MCCHCPPLVTFGTSLQLGATQKETSKQTKKQQSKQKYISFLNICKTEVYKNVNSTKMTYSIFFLKKNRQVSTQKMSSVLVSRNP